MGDFDLIYDCAMCGAENTASRMRPCCENCIREANLGKMLLDIPECHWVQKEIDGTWIYGNAFSHWHGEAPEKAILDDNKEYRKMPWVCEECGKGPCQCLDKPPDPDREAIELLGAAAIEHVGERCPDFHPNCLCCRVWQLIDKMKGR